MFASLALVCFSYLKVEYLINPLKISNSCDTHFINFNIGNYKYDGLNGASCVYVGVEKY